MHSRTDSSRRRTGVAFKADRACVIVAADMMRAAPILSSSLLIACSSSAAVKPAPEAPAPVASTSSPTAPTPPPTPAPSPIPDTPAGKALTAWLDAFNSGDEARMRDFAAQHKSPDIVDAEFRQMTGGFELVSIENSAPNAITIVVKEKARSMKAVGWLKLKDDGLIGSVAFHLIPPGVTAADRDRTIDAAGRARVIDGIVAKLDELYVFPDVAKKMGEAVRAHQNSGTYDSLTASRAFAERLTEDLRAVSKDKHLSVMFMPKEIPEINSEPSEQEKAGFRQQMEQINCGFKKAERLDGGNIGYIRFDMFGDAEICGPKATAAFEAVAGVDALIVDLRHNGGGQPEMVAFVSSYLFDKRTHLNDIYDRKENKTTKFWTKPSVPGKKLAKQPVYVLTSQRTFSGAEEFSYNLKNLKRATVVGETTGGGAHPTTGARVDAHFMIGVPFARAINPITKTNWEGTGVEPHVKVAADEALETAKQLAVEEISKQQAKKKSAAKRR
jgi:retinol-binding protein 3